MGSLPESMEGTRLKTPWLSLSLVTSLPRILTNMQKEKERSKKDLSSSIMSQMNTITYINENLINGRTSC